MSVAKVPDFRRQCAYICGTTCCRSDYCPCGRRISSLESGNAASDGLSGSTRRTAFDGRVSSHVQSIPLAKHEKLCTAVLSAETEDVKAENNLSRSRLPRPSQRMVPPVLARRGGWRRMVTNERMLPP